MAEPVYYVYYNAGSCNYGDHDCGLEGPYTEADARKRAKDILARDDDATVFILYGNIVTEKVRA